MATASYTVPFPTRATTRDPADAWEESFPRGSWEDEIYSLGNLTLVESATNRRVGNAVYAEKCAAYAQSGYALTKRIPGIVPEQWTLAQLDQRQRQLAGRVCTCGRICVMR